MRWVRACTCVVVGVAGVSSACSILEGLDQYSETTCTQGCQEAGDGPTVTPVLHDDAGDDHRVQAVIPDSQAPARDVVEPIVADATGDTSMNGDDGADVAQADAAEEPEGDATTDDVSQDVGVDATDASDVSTVDPLVGTWTCTETRTLTITGITNPPMTQNATITVTVTSGDVTAADVPEAGTPCTLHYTESGTSGMLTGATQMCTDNQIAATFTSGSLSLSGGTLTFSNVTGVFAGGTIVVSETCTKK